MSVISNRTIGIAFEQDVNAPNLAYAAAENATAPGSIVTQDLVSGNNIITVPSGSKAVTIIPPAGNAVVLLLKGVAGDTGISLHPTDPTSIGLANTVTQFVVNAAAGVTGMRFIFS